MSGQSFEEWREHILHSLRQQHEEHREVRAVLTEIQIQLAGLKVRAGLWGALAGALPAIAAILYSLLR